jgi:hypothetical protein
VRRRGATIAKFTLVPRALFRRGATIAKFTLVPRALFQREEEVDEEEEDGRRIMEKHKSPKALGGGIHLRWALLQKPTCTPLLQKTRPTSAAGVRCDGR